MTFTDEQLSGFLDAALPEAEMAQIRAQLAEDDALVARLAELAMVDSLVQQHYEKINQQPLPEAITALLSAEAKPEVPHLADQHQHSATVIHFPLWRRLQQQMQQHAAAVAVFALVAGFGLAQFAPTEQSHMLALQDAISEQLTHAPSGQTYPLLAEHSISPALSFIGNDGQFCRQYQLTSPTQRTENIACNEQGHWQVKASIAVANSAANGLYQTASGGSVLDPILDTLMSGPALTQAEEQQQLNAAQKAQ